jgi:hypothetical protein
MKTIHVRKMSSDTKRATAALTVLVAGDWLRPIERDAEWQDHTTRVEDL